MTSARRLLLVILSASILLIGLVIPVQGLQDSRSTNDGTVTATAFVTYTHSACSDGQPADKVTGVFTKFTRTGSGRKVPTSHVLAIGWGHPCPNNGQGFSTQAKKGTWSPVFGCGGRCGANETAKSGISVSFVFIRTQGGCDITLCRVGGSGDGHAKTSSGSALNPNPICVLLPIPGNNGSMGCPDAFSG
jgi:hypothetical protein